MYRYLDTTGNILFAEKSLRYNGLDIFITLANERHRRHIGRVNFDTSEFYVERDSTKHVLKKGNAYGFNYHVLSTAKKFDKLVVLETDTGRLYRVETAYILKEGKFLHFKQQGLEKQIFVSREWLSYYEIHNQQTKQKIMSNAKTVS